MKSSLLQTMVPVVSGENFFAGTMTTEDFFDGFDDVFTKENGGKPNGAITFRHKNTNKFEGPLVSVFVEAAYKTDAGKFVYKLRQSKDQETVNALEDFFGSSTDDGAVEYEMCSLFIDNGELTQTSQGSWWLSG